MFNCTMHTCTCTQNKSFKTFFKKFYILSIKKTEHTNTLFTGHYSNDIAMFNIFSCVISFFVFLL
jgi:hypothetical protein